MHIKSVAAAATIALAACTPTQDSSSGMRGDGKWYRTLHPSPKAGYVITMKLENAPGTFEVIRGVAHYQVENPECGRPMRWAGTFPRMTSSEGFEFKQASDGVYRGKVYLDQIVDEDYYGRGLCRWRFIGLDGFLRATDDERDTRFRPGMDDDEVYAERSIRNLFWIGQYPRSGMDGFASYGEQDRTKFAPHISDDQLFTVTMTSEGGR